MRPIQIIGTLSLVLLAVTSSTWAQSLETRKIRADQEAALGGQVTLTNTKCGTSLTARIDWNTFDEAEVLTKRVMSWCQAALDAVEDICGDALGKTTDQNKLLMLSLYETHTIGDYESCPGLKRWCSTNIPRVPTTVPTPTSTPCQKAQVFSWDMSLPPAVRCGAAVSPMPVIMSRRLGYSCKIAPIARVALACSPDAAPRSSVMASSLSSFALACVSVIVGASLLDVAVVPPTIP